MSEAFNRAHIAADYPVYGDPDFLPAWAATDDRLEATQSDADAAAKRFWQRSSWYRRASIRSQPLAGQPLMDELSTQGAVATEEVVDAAVAGDPMAKRRLEDETFAAFAEGSIVFLDLPDAVFRGYANDEELLNTPRPDDRAPYELLRREIARLEPQKLYLPLGIGNHVDHQLCRDVGVRLLAEGRRWVMPGPDYAGIVTFYEDFPYAWWNDFTRLEDLPPAALQRPSRRTSPCAGVRRHRRPARAEDHRDQRSTTSQIERLFTCTEGDGAPGSRARPQDRAAGGWGGSAERYWATGPA